MRRLFLPLLCLTLAACATPERPRAIGVPEPVDRFEAISLFGTELPPPNIDPDRRRRFETLLDRAEDDYERNPDYEMAAIWVGRRLAYLGRYRDAVDHYTAALQRFPNSYKLLRHRGHRNITLRRLDAAIDDLSHAAELARGVPDAPEPDGLPNAAGVPRSTTKSNIYYHLGLAHYLKGDAALARQAWEECLRHAAVNDDMLVATLYWPHNALVRQGEPEAALLVAARAHPDMQILENHAYHGLLLAIAGGSVESYLGAQEPGALDWITVAYGVSVDRERRGGESSARALRELILEEDNWPAFGYIAAEADLARAETAGRIEDVVIDAPDKQ